MIFKIFKVVCEFIKTLSVLFQGCSFIKEIFEIEWFHKKTKKQITANKKDK